MTGLPFSDADILVKFMSQTSDHCFMELVRLLKWQCAPVPMMSLCVTAAVPSRAFQWISFTSKVFLCTSLCCFAAACACWSAQHCLCV